MRDRIYKELRGEEEVEGYRVEILFPGTDVSVYLIEKSVPEIGTIKKTYGMFARIGKIEPLMRVEQHKRILKEKLNE